MIEAILMSAALGAMPPAVAGCEVKEWPVTEGGNGHQYQMVVVPSGVSWTDARAAALAAGGDLASLQSQAEAEWVYEHISRDLAGWIGFGGGPWVGGFQDLNDPSYSEPGGGWFWVTGEPISYANWGGAEPNDSGVAENFLSYQDTNNNGPFATWGDRADFSDPFSSRAFVIEWVRAAVFNDCDANGVADPADVVLGSATDADANGVLDQCDATATGACCLAGGACIAATAQNCFAAGGRWAGPSVSCDQDPCVELCFEDVNGDGQVNFIDLLAVLFVWGACP